MAGKVGACPVPPLQRFAPGQPQDTCRRGGSHAECHYVDTRGQARERSTAMPRTQLLPRLALRPPLQVRHIGVSNETSFGVMRFIQASARQAAEGRAGWGCGMGLRCRQRGSPRPVHPPAARSPSPPRSLRLPRPVQAAEQAGLPRIVSIQNSYSLAVRGSFETDLAEVCAPRNCNVGLLAYSPLAAGCEGWGRPGVGLGLEGGPGRCEGGWSCRPACAC